MKLIVSDKIKEMFPSLRIGVVTGVVKNEQKYSELNQCCKQAYVEFKNKYPSNEQLFQQKNILIWRETYRKIGVNPKKKVPTAESFLSRIVKGNFTPQICPIVDAYLVAERLCCLPIGGYDLSMVEGDIDLRISSGNEVFQGLGSDAEELTEPGEIVYSDEGSILTRRWNYRDAKHTSIHKDSKNVALFVEAPTLDIRDDELSKTLEEISKNLREYCGAESNYFIFDTAKNSSVEVC